MFSFRSLALIVLGTPFLSACIENACKSDEHQDVSFCQATDMSMSQSADDKAGDMAMPTTMCQSSNGVCTCTLQFGTGGLSVKGVAMKRVDMNLSRLALLLEGGMSTIVDVASVSNACSILSNRTHNVTTATSGESSMAASRSFILFARDNILASSPWDLGYVNYSQKLTGKHLSVASNVNGTIYAMIAETPGTDMALTRSVSVSKSYEFVGDNLASVISADSNGKIAIGVNDELFVWTGTGAGTGYKYSKPETALVYGANQKTVQSLSVCNGKLCPVGVGDVSHDTITDLVTADSSGIHVYKGSSDLGQFTDITSNYAKIITHLNMATKVQAIAVEIPSGVNASDPPRLVWATAENDTNAKQTKVTVNLLPLPLLQVNQ